MSDPVPAPAQLTNPKPDSGRTAATSAEPQSRAAGIQCGAKPIVESPNVSTDARGRLISADRIRVLVPGEIFVFGSNAGGRHGSGAARFAMDHFGAVYGEGHGLHGQSYAIDTMSGLDVLAAEIDTFLSFAETHPELTFLVTEIGCGIVGYQPAQIAPFFVGAPRNVALPRSFAAE